MAEVKPFRAWHYDSDRVSVDRVIAPPYDVISEKENRELHDRDPHNVIRLELGVPDPKNPPPDSKYREAKNYFLEWSQHGFLTQDSKDSFYLYQMSYRHPYRDQILTRLSVYGALKLEEFDRKIVFPHEKTHATAKVDRMKLLKETECNFSPIFALYEDQSSVLEQIQKKAEARGALFDFSDLNGMAHKLWLIQNEEEVSAIKNTFEGRRIFIADGHHRYETALAYAREKNNQKAIAGLHSWDYVLAAFVRFHDPGLLILPIHRMILNSVNIEKESFLSGLKKHFVLHSVSRAVLGKISEGALTEGFGLAFSDEECYSLELKDKTMARLAMPPQKPQVWYDLDMNLISFLILEPLLKLETAKLEHQLSYSANLNEVFERLRAGTASTAFVIRPVTASVIKNICESGELMPQKSTYFYPKFPSGLLIYKH